MKVADLFGWVNEGIVTLYEMAMGKDAFKKKLVGRIDGAFREYICNEIAKKLKELPEWDVEVSKLTKVINDIIRDSIIKGIRANSEKIKNNVVYEVLNECTPYFIVREARDKLHSQNYYPDKFKQIEFVEIDGEEEFRNFVVKYLPERFHNFEEYKGKF